MELDNKKMKSTRASGAPKRSGSVRQVGGGLMVIAAGMTAVWLAMPALDVAASEGPLDEAPAAIETAPVAMHDPALLTIDAPPPIASRTATGATPVSEPAPTLLASGPGVTRTGATVVRTLAPTIQTNQPEPNTTATAPDTVARLERYSDAARTIPTISRAHVDTVEVNVGQSAVVDAPWPVARVSITNTEVADVQVLTPNQVLLVGKELGTTDMILWNQNEDVWHARVGVVLDLEYVGQELAKVFPDCDLVLEQSQNLLVVGGDLRRLDQVDQLQSALDSYGVAYLNKTSVAGVQQVMLNVKVAEVSRRAIKEMGTNAFYGGDNFFGGLTIGPDGGSAINPINIGAPAGSIIGDTAFSFIDDLGVASGVTLFGGFANSDLSFFLKALDENQYLRVLAEPTLVATSGAAASFLAGGEFPVPVVQGTGVGSGATVTIEYKEFGIRLNFVPMVLGENDIRLEVAPEVSDLSDFGSIEIEGFKIPGVVTRRSETTIELKSGQTFMMAGLLNQTTAIRKSQVPLLGDLPVVGALFRSTRYQSGETELVILVNASLVEPAGLDSNFPVPGDLHEDPNDWELFVEGRMSKQARPVASPADAEWMRSNGLDRLHGPGAWARPGQAATDVQHSRRRGTW